MEQLLEKYNAPLNLEKHYSSSPKDNNYCIIVWIFLTLLEPTTILVENMSFEPIFGDKD